MHSIKIALSYFAVFMASFRWAAAQTPTDLPTQTEPVDFTSTTALLFYILVPIFMFVFYYLWRKRKIKEMRDEEKEDNKNSK